MNKALTNTADLNVGVGAIMCTLNVGHSRGVNVSMWCLQGKPGVNIIIFLADEDQAT